MFDSGVTAFPAQDFDPTDPRQVEAWIASLPPITKPNKRDIGAMLLRIGDQHISFRITRAALEKIAGEDGPSTSALAQKNWDAIEHHCAALVERSSQPAGGWVLDVSDLIS